MLRAPPDGFFDSDLEEEDVGFDRELPSILHESVPFAMSSAVGIESILGNLSLNQISSAHPAPRSHEPESTEFYFEQANNYNLIIDPSSTVAKPILLYASPMKLIEHLATTLDYKLMDDFLLSLEAFVEPSWFAECLISLLKKVFKISATNWLVSADMVEVMKMRCLVILQHWHSNVAVSFSETLPSEIRKIVLNGLDAIWTQARIISDGDKRLIAKVRRLYDPSCEHSQYAESVQREEHHRSYSDAESDIGADSLDFQHNSKWSVRWKAKLKSFFSRSSRSQAQLQMSPCSSLLITSFSSDIEDRDNEACQILMCERSKNLATILMAVEADLFGAIERSELVLFAKSRDHPMKLATNCSNLQRSIDHFNSMCRWFAHVLTTQPDPQTAAELLAKLIRLAVKCMLVNNFNSFLQIILALQTPVVANLTEMWEILPTWEQRLARDLAAFGSPARNFKNIRRAMDEVFDGEELECPPGTVPIPFTGLFLSDSVYNWEQQDEQLQSLPRHVPKPLPVYKCHVTAKIVRQFRLFKQASLKNHMKLNEKQRALYSYFADIGRLGGDFLESC